MLEPEQSLSVQERSPSDVRTLQLRPVLTTLGAVPLHGPRGHHYHQHPQLPDHLPGVYKGPGQRSLHGNEGFSLLISVHKVGIDVVGLPVIIVPVQNHPGVVVAQHVRVTVL